MARRPMLRVACSSSYNSSIKSYSRSCLLGKWWYSEPAVKPTCAASSRMLTWPKPFSANSAKALSRRSSKLAQRIAALTGGMALAPQ
ncbi:hypothetical protein D3C71_2034120 [compost metagenome]